MVHAKSAREWSRMTDDDFAEVDSAWRSGDGEEELRTEDDLLYEEMERRKHNAPPLDLEDIDPEYVPLWCRVVPAVVGSAGLCSTVADVVVDVA